MIRAMRVGVSASRLDLRGGMERYALTLVGGLADLGAEVVVFCRRADAGLPEAGRIRDVRRLGEGWWLPGKFRDLRFSRRLDREISGAGLDAHVGCCLLEHPDIAACGGTHRGYLKALGKKPDWFDRRKIGLEERQYANARLIVAHSELMREELVSLYGVGEERIRLLYPPVDAGRFRPAAAGERRRLRREFGFPDDRKVFVLVSGGHARKGLPFLRSFFEKTSLPVLLAVAGREAAPGRNVMSLGYSRSVERLYQAADAAVLASRYEPFGLVGPEAAMCGTPVVVSSNTGCLNALSPRSRLAFTAGDMESLEAAAREALVLDRSSLPGGREALAYDPSAKAHAEKLLEAA